MRCFMVSRIMGLLGMVIIMRCFMVLRVVVMFLAFIIILTKFFHSINGRDNPTKEETRNNAIHFFYSLFCDIFFKQGVFLFKQHNIYLRRRSSNSGEFYFSTLIVFEKKESFGMCTMMTFSSTVARILLNARFSGRIMERENAPKKHSSTSIRFASI